MSRIRIRHPDLPAGLQTWVLVGPSGVPRFWAAVWQTLKCANQAESTLGRHLSAIERLYVHVVNTTGHDALDTMISQSDFEALGVALQGFFSVLRNEAIRTGEDNSRSWATALQFIRDIAGGSKRSAGLQAMRRLETHLSQFETLYASLTPSRRRTKPARLRALPATVVEELLNTSDPCSPLNPFRTEQARWRNHALLLLLLFQGLRRGEALILPANACHDGVDPSTGEMTLWLDVDNLVGEDDPRSERPGIKTAHSRRQIPIHEDVVSVLDHYVRNFRGRQDHVFLFASDRGRPISLRSVTYIFQVLSEALSETAKLDLWHRCKAKAVTAHDLRHTCAVARLGQYTDSGMDQKLAIQCLRSFFGWSKDSQMPNHYAQAHYEDRLKTVFRKRFDDRVEILRQLHRIDRNSSLLISRNEDVQ